MNQSLYFVTDRSVVYIMNLKESLLSDMKEALKARNSLTLNTIRGLISEIKNQEIDLRRELHNDEIISLVSTQIKKRGRSPV